MRVLLVDDDDIISQIIEYYLDIEGHYQVTRVKTAGEALGCMSIAFDVILLDILLPDVNGISLCEKLREWQNCPIIFISCLDDADTVVNALERGGDDFIVKPFDNRILNARIQANVRRAQRASDASARPRPSAPKIDSLEIDAVSRRVSFPGGSCVLTPIEFQLFDLLVRNPSRHYTARELYESVWGADSLGNARTVMVHMHNLRTKLGEDVGRAIANDWGEGYVFDPSMLESPAGKA